MWKWNDIVRLHRKTLAEFREFRLAGCNVMASHYETMVADPDHWIRLLALFLGISQGGKSNTQWELLLRMAKDEKNITPNENTHIAYLFPGSYANHLNRTTIARLVQTLSSKDRPPQWEGAWPLTAPSNGVLLKGLMKPLLDSVDDARKETTGADSS